MAASQPAPRCADSSPPYGTLAFDCDSTLVSIEGIDELAEIAGGRKAEIAALTSRAMAGEIALEDVYGRRLELLKPDRSAIETLAQRYLAAKLEHARELVLALRALEKRVAIVSGALRQAILPLARELGVDEPNVHAVEVYHDREGRYAGFDELSPLCRSHGKLEVVRDLARSDRAGGVAFVGDGATDLEAAVAARRFVAFGGVERRAAVFERARVMCDSPDLALLLPWLASYDELERLARSRQHDELLRAAGAIH